MDPELAYQLTKLLFDQKKALAEWTRRPAGWSWRPPPRSPLELHPGAKRNYDEQAKT